jgi:hypothetical protein
VNKNKSLTFKIIQVNNNTDQKRDQVLKKERNNPEVEKISACYRGNTTNPTQRKKLNN